MKSVLVLLALIALCGSGCAFTMTLESSRLADASLEKRELDTIKQNLQRFSAEIQQAPDDKAVNAILVRYGIERKATTQTP